MDSFSILKAHLEFGSPSKDSSLLSVLRSEVILSISLFSCDFLSLRLCDLVEKYCMCLDFRSSIFSFSSDVRKFAQQFPLNVKTSHLTSKFLTVSESVSVTFGTVLNLATFDLMLALNHSNSFGVIVTNAYLSRTLLLLVTCPHIVFLMLLFVLPPAMIIFNA